MTALVFGAGGAYGAYEAGVWKALDERGFRPDIVVGSSIGSINATAVARGASGDTLANWWRDPRADVFRCNTKLHGPAMFDQRVLAARLDDLLRDLPVTLRGVKLLIITTQVRGLVLRAISDPQISTRSLLASCAVPGVFPPVFWDGHWNVDGGVVCLLPLRPAADAGATEVVSVNLLAHPSSILVKAALTLLTAGRRLFVRQPDCLALPAGVRHWPIAPQQALGSLRDMFHWDLATVNRWIDLGYCDAAAVWDRRSRESHASAAQPSSPSAERAAPR